MPSRLADGSGVREKEILPASLSSGLGSSLMGGRGDITLVARDSITAENNIDTVITEITRIENRISDWRPSSQVSEVNRNAGIRPVKVNPEVFALTERALHLSEITHGAFDISFAAMDKIWKFDGSMTKMPSPEAIKKSVEKVGYQNIVLNKQNSTIYLKLKGMKILRLSLFDAGT